MQKQRKQFQDQGRHTAAYIRAQKDELMQSVRGPQPDCALHSFYKDMSALCSRPESCINYMHLNAIIGATAKAWTPAWAGLSQQKQQQTRHAMHAFLTKMFQRLQPLLPDVGAREAANLLWSSAKLWLNPEALVPGMTDSLARQFMVDMDAAIGQHFTNVLVACAKLQLSPCHGDLVQAVCGRLAIVDMSTFSSQAVANTLHSLATMSDVAPSVEVLDVLCQRFDALLRSSQAAEIPNAQGIANTLWALSKLKHAPADELAMSMVGRMVALCNVPRQQPKMQEVSNFLLACAHLRVPVKKADTDSLASFLLSSNRQPGDQQAYVNTAWSLAVIGHLRQAHFTLMLDQMHALSSSPHETSAPPVLTAAQLTQLYQALDWLQPHSTAPAEEQSAWSSLQGKLHRLGPRPVPDKPPSFGSRKLCAALNQLQLSFKAMVVIQSYWVTAVLQSQDSKAQPVIMRLSTPDYITNIPGRSGTTAPLLVMPALVFVCLIAKATRCGLLVLYGSLFCSQRLCAIAITFSCCMCALPARQHNSHSSLHTLQVDRACSVQHPLYGQARPAG